MPNTTITSFDHSAKHADPALSEKYLTDIDIHGIIKMDPQSWDDKETVVVDAGSKTLQVFYAGDKYGKTGEAEKFEYTW